MKHGTLNTYKAGCRCEDCRWANARYDKQRRYERLQGHTRLIDATGTRRRLLALGVMRWPRDNLAARLGKDPRQIRLFITTLHVRATTADKVTALYDELAMIPGPGHRNVEVWARRRGGYPPLAWDDETIDDPKAKPQGLYETPKLMHDEVAVQRAVDGDTSVHLSSADRAEAIAILHSRGLTARAIAERMGLQERSVTRIRAVSRRQEYQEQVAS